MLYLYHFLHILQFILFSLIVHLLIINKDEVILQNLPKNFNLIENMLFWR